MPKFSIITICYNEPHLEDTCKTVVTQTLQDFEWIVIDGGSNKETLDIFEKYKSRIDYFVSEKDNGRYNAMNKGIRQAHGEYLIFMNAGDCFYEPQTLEKVSKFIENKHADIFYGNGYMRKGDKIRLLQIPAQLTEDFLYEAALFHQAMFYQKDVFQKYGYYDENLKIVSDWKHYFNVFLNGGIFEYIPLNIAVDDDGGISSSPSLVHKQERKSVLEEILGKEKTLLLKNKIFEQKTRFQNMKNLINSKRSTLSRQKASKKVSVIIPVYNAHDYLERCLDSVCTQTLKDIEIIAVDDCSTDDSLEILNEYAAKYPQLQVIARKTNGGESRARNTGIDAATGEYLAFVDNDDMVDLDFYEKLYNKAKEESADIAKGEVHIIEYDKTETFGQLNKKIREHNNKFYFAYQWWTAIYKTAIIKENNIRLPEGYPLGGDILFLDEIVIKANKIALVDDAFYHYYRREDSGDSKVLSFEKIKSAATIFEMILQNIRKTGIKNDGISFVASAWLLQLLNYPYRTRDENVLKYILRKILNYYQQSKDLIIDNSYLNNCLPVIMHLIKSNDFDEFLNFYLTNNTQQKMFIANLRYIHSKESRNVK